MTLWRISNHADLRGEGGRRASARWHRAGRPVVYLAETPAGALLEILAHLETMEGDSPVRYQLLSIQIPDTLPELLLTPEREDWKLRIDITQSLGEAWLAAGESLLARVPSALVPHTFNYLFNPLHPQAAQALIVSVEWTGLDERFQRAHHG